MTLKEMRKRGQGWDILSSSTDCSEYEIRVGADGTDCPFRYTVGRLLYGSPTGSCRLGTPLHLDCAIGAVAAICPVRQGPITVRMEEVEDVQ